MATSRIRFQADRLVIATGPSDAGGLIFESGTVNGVTSTILRAARIGDLTVDTLQLENESVTVPNVETSPSLVQTTSNTVWSDFLEDEFTISSVAGATIFLQVQADFVAVGQNTSPPVPVSIRVLIDGVEVESYTSGAAVLRNVRFIIAEVTSTGDGQTINITWQFRSGLSGGTAGISAGAKMLRVAHKR